MNDSDSEILLPWSPVNLSARQNIKTPEEDNHSSESNDSPISPIGYSRQQLKLSPSSTSANLVSADTSKIEDTPPLHFSDGHLPWSPPSIKIMQPPVKQIAYLFGDIKHPLVKKISPILAQEHNVDLIVNVAEQPPKPFPLFYLHQEGVDDNQYVKVGNKCSDGHCILMVGEESLESSENTIIKLPSTHDEEGLALLCQQISECVDRVYEHKQVNAAF